MSEGLILYSTAFGLGAVHALEPGHGKTLIAAYLTGTKGKMQDAFLLGLLVTIFHTISVICIALGVSFLADALIPDLADHITPYLEGLSGAIILLIGLNLLWQRHIKQKPVQSKLEEQDHHQACGCGHEHVLENNIETVNLKTLFALGFASGITPCPIALALIFSALTLGGLGEFQHALTFLLTFSLGLGTVLSLIGLALIFFKQSANQFSFGKNPTLANVAGTLSIFLLIGLGSYMILNAIFGSSHEHDKMPALFSMLLPVK